MAAVLKTDTQALGHAASSYEAIADDLKAQIAKVQTAATNLEQHWQGAAAKAAQAALKRFDDAATAHVTQLNDISNSLTNAGIQYSATDEERVSALQRAMGMGGGR